MGIFRRTRRAQAGSLESMADPVNQSALPAVDGRWTRITRMLWPPRCLLCGDPGHGGRDLCLACVAMLPWNR
ncbi:MAG TPA: double zinc ribbon domain-containing protein, partial [Lysobacter sp.]|nr:double zinc ribbon domain-containing protein [Lysobacter sp.]